MTSSTEDGGLSMVSLMELLCQQLMKMISIDDSYVDLLIGAGLLDECLFPFLSRAAMSRDDEMLKMSRTWCLLLGSMTGSLATEAKIQESGVNHTLHELLPIETDSVLLLLGKLCMSEDEGLVSMELSTLLEVLQKQKDPVLRRKVLLALTKMMQKNHMLKDRFRELGGFESLLGVMVSLQDSNVVDELVQVVFGALTVAMSGDHTVNREYLRDEIQYEALSSTFDLIGMFVHPKDILLVDMVIGCVTESPSITTCRIVNIEPLQIITHRLSSLEVPALVRFLDQLVALVESSHPERAANCSILNGSWVRKFLLDQLGEQVLVYDNDSELKNDLRGSFVKLMGYLGRHRCTTKFLLHLLRMKDAVPGVLDILAACANLQGDDAFVVPYVQMAGPSGRFVLAPISRNARRVSKNLGSHRSVVELNAPGSIHIPSLGKRAWPPSSGYTLSMWVWVGDAGNEDVLLMSMRHCDGSQYLRVTLRSDGDISIRSCGSSVNISGSSGATGDGTRGMAAAAFAAVLAMAEESASLSRSLSSSQTRKDLQTRLVEQSASHEVRFKQPLSSEAWHHVCIVHKVQVSGNIGSMLLDKAAAGKVQLFVDGVLVGTEKLAYPPSVSHGGLKTSLFVGVDPIIAATRSTGQKARNWRAGPLSVMDVPKDVEFARAVYLCGVKNTACLTRSSAIIRDPRCFATVLLQQLALRAECTGTSVCEQLGRLEIPCGSWKELLRFSASFLNHSAFVDRSNVVCTFYAGRRAVLEGLPSFNSRVLVDKHIQQVEIPRVVLINTVEIPLQQSILAILGGGAVAIEPLPLAESVRSIGGEFMMLRFLEQETDVTERVLTLLMGILQGNERNVYSFRQNNGQKVVAWLLYSLQQHHHKVDPITEGVLEGMLRLSVNGSGDDAVIVDPEMLHHIVLNNQLYRNRASGSVRWKLIVVTFQIISNLVDTDNRNRKLNLDALHRLNIIDWVLESMLALAVDIPEEEQTVFDVLSGALQFLSCLNKGALVRRTLFEMFRYILVSLPDQGVPAVGKKPRRGSVTDQLVRTKPVTPKSRPVDTLMRGESILRRIRIMLFEVVFELPENSSERKRVYMTYADILSAHWFSCLLDASSDRETYALALRLLGDLMQVSDAFSHHFLSSKGMERVATSMHLNENSPLFILSGMCLLLGIPLTALGRPIELVPKTSVKKQSRIKNFLSPSARTRLMRRLDSVESDSAVNTFDDIVHTFTEILHRVDSIHVPEWSPGVFDCMVAVCIRLVKETSQVDICLKLIEMMEVTLQEYPEVQSVFGSKSFTESLTMLAFAGPSFTGPVPLKVLELYTAMICLSLSGEQRVAGLLLEPRRLMETILQSYPVDADAATVLAFQPSVAQALLPSLSMLVDDGTWRARSNGMQLPYNADPDKIVSLVCYITGRASFGWVPGFEHTVLEVIVQAYSCVKKEEPRARITRCIRGLVLWTLETSMMNLTVDRNQQLLNAVIRNFDQLRLEDMKTAPPRHTEQVNSYVIAQSSLPSHLNLPLDLSDEPTLFAVCFLQLIIKHLSLCMENHLIEVYNCLVQLLHQFGLVSTTRRLCGLAVLKEGFEIINDIDAFRGWNKTNDGALHATVQWMSSIWSRAKHLELFGSPRQCGLANHEELRAIIPSSKKAFLVAEIHMVQERRKHRAEPPLTSQLDEQGAKLIAATHHDAVERHKRWNRVGLTNLIRGKRYWDAQVDKLKTGPNRQLFRSANNVFGDRWELDPSETVDRMRRRTVAHSSFESVFHYVEDGVIVEPIKSEEVKESNVELEMNEVLKTLRYTSSVRNIRSTTEVDGGWISEWEDTPGVSSRGDDIEVSDMDSIDGDTVAIVAEDVLFNEERERRSSPDPLDLSDFEPKMNEMQTIDDEIAELGWAGDERLYTEIELAPDNKPTAVYNCAAVQGLEETRGVCLVCPTSVYFVSSYQHSATSGFEEIPAMNKHLVYNVSLRDRKIHILEHDNVADDEDTSRSFTSMPYKDLREVHRRRFMFREVGLEMFLVDGMNIFLVFNANEDRDAVFSHVMSQELPNSEIRLSEDALASLVAPFRKFRDSATRKWINGEISNFAYLMHLNYLAGRSFNDLTQYPVMPWVIQQFTEPTLDLSDIKSFRDLSKPMGALDPERETQFLERYAALESQTHETGLQPFHFGTHYSCSAYVLQFLMRLEPFTNMGLQLQGGQFDRPDRLFSSISGKFSS